MTMETSASKIPFFVLIAAAGSGERMGGGTPKQYRSIGGKAILRHTIERFLACDGCQGIRVVINPNHKNLYENAVAGLDLYEPALGLGMRKFSINNGLKSFSDLKNEDIILLHDAARPFVETSYIEAVVQAVKSHKAATLALPVSNTLKHENGDYVDRNGLWSVQTPQGFEYGLIMLAHEQADPQGHYTDDTSLVEALGRKVHLVRGSPENIKITWEEDFIMAEKLLETEIRTGTGFDVHAFDTAKSGPVRLCGVDIEHPHALAGHSDADVGLHALTDALLGTIAAGDIGEHFPPSDPQWKGKDSTVFLQHACNMVREKGGVINHLDLTMICETPKIGPHKDEMRTRVAEICNLTKDRVSIKATTTEKLGFTGRGEGIAAQAIATVALPHQ